MSYVVMPDLYTRLKPTNKKLKIPGGWKAYVPEIAAVDPKSEKVYGRFFQSQGMTSLRANEEVLKRFNGTFRQAWLRYLGISIRYWARKYAKRFPSTMQSDGTLEGFQPEKLQYVYVPGTNKGRAGIQVVNRLFNEMREASDG